MVDDRPELSLPTRVGRAIAGGNDYFGFRVERNFTDAGAFWRSVLLAIGAGPSSFEHLQLVKRLAGCNLVADPRIWPLKLTRLASSYGGIMAGFCAGNVFLEAARIGPLAARHAAEFLCSIVGFWDEGRGELADELERRRVLGHRFPGYGVPFRAIDERVSVIDRIVMEEGRDSGRYWRCSIAVEAALTGRRQLPRNVVCAVAAVLLDCGLTPLQVGLLMWIYVIPAYLANAVEGAQQAAPVLCELPSSCIKYDGPPHRVSPAMLRRG
jgi:hypothetical protein